MIIAITAQLPHHHRHRIRRLAVDAENDGEFAAASEGFGEGADVDLVEAGKLALGDGAEDGHAFASDSGGDGLLEASDTGSEEE